MASQLQQVVYLPATSSGGSSEVQQYLIFFIPGNPGPAAYYRGFLSSLQVALLGGPTSKSAAFEILAVSLSGAGAAADGSPPVSAMTGEIEHMEATLLGRVSTLAADRGKKSPIKVVLVGHCAGAYIALELLKRWRQDDSHVKEHRFSMAGTVCLFPPVPVKTLGGTVSQAAVSPPQQHLVHHLKRNLGWAAEQLTMLSNSALFVHHSVKLLLFLVPSVVIETLLRSTTGLSQDAVKVTNEMVGSQWGIYQALTLWRSQVEDQKSGRWDDAIYVSNCATTPPTYMLFSQNDGEPEVGRSQGRLDLVAGIHKSQLPDRFFTSKPIPRCLTMPTPAVHHHAPSFPPGSF
ncbi:hypothetical protein SLS54_008742 [Diplodia seriata]